MIVMASGSGFGMPSESTSPWSMLQEGFLSLASLPEDPVLRIAVFSALALGGLTLLIMIQVLVVSELSARRERHRQAFISLWRPRLAAWSLTNNDELPSAPRRGEQLWFLLLWTRLQRQMRGYPRERLNQLFASLGMTNLVMAMLRSRATHRRLLALTCLRYLADTRHWLDVSPLLASPNPVVALSAAHAMVEMDPQAAMREVIPRIEERTDWAMPRLVSLCRQAGRDAVTPVLLSSLTSANPATGHRLVGLLTCADPRSVAPWARQQLVMHVVDGEETDARCAALLCLGELSDPRDRPLVLNHLEHSSPRVRLLAVRALGRQAGPGDIPALLQRLTDADWWVRQAAADVIVALPGSTRNQLVEMESDLLDPYGRDALRRAMAEGNR